MDAARKALALEGTNPLANAALARAQYYGGDPAFPDTAERTLALDPTTSEVTALMGILLTACGDDARGFELVARAQAMAPQPRPPFNVAYVFAASAAGKPCKAQAAAEKWTRRIGSLLTSC